MQDMTRLSMYVEMLFFLLALILADDERDGNDVDSAKIQKRQGKSYFANTTQEATVQDVAGYRNVDNPLLRACLARTMKTMLHSAARILLQKCSVQV